MICLTGIEKYYRTGRAKTFVLKKLSLEIEEGEFVSIMGPSGAGKSTLLHIMGMLDAPSQGQYYFLGQAVDKLNEKKRTELHQEHIGFVFQAFHLIEEMTVYENLELPLLYKKVKRDERKKRVREMVERFGLGEKQKLFPAQLSGGEQQLVGIGRALVPQPAVILADEPTGNLQSAQGDEIMTLLKKLNEEGTTIVQVTHAEEKAAVGKRIIALRDGQVESDRKLF